MLRDLSVILVVDVQSTSRAASDDGGASDPGEITEIGIASVDTGALRILQLDDLMVTPSQARHAVTAHAGAKIPEPAGASAVPFAEACRIMKRRYLAPDVAWASWTDLTRQRIERQCRSQAIPCPFSGTHITVSNLFALAHNLAQELGVPAAMEQAKLPLEAASPRAHHAARNVARLLISLLQRCRK
jgi:inhibitor of KinA sporulation pathway (predicted exonuclease)